MTDTAHDRPLPGPGRAADDAAPGPAADDRQSGQQDSDQKTYAYGEDPDQDFVDRDVIDFDPEDGLYSGTVVSGDTDIDGPHIGDDGKVDEQEQKQFEEEGRKQAKEQGILDDDGNLKDAKDQTGVAAGGMDDGNLAEDDASE